MKTCKIVITTTEYVDGNNFDGGLAQYTYKIATILRKRGHDVLVLVSNLDHNYDTFHQGIRVKYVKPTKGIWYWFLNILTGFKFNPALLQYIRSKSINKWILKNLDNNYIIHYTSSMCLGLYPLKKYKHCLRISSLLHHYNSAEGFERDIRIKQKEFLFNKMMKNNQNIISPSLFTNQLVKKEYQKESKLISTPLSNIKVEYDFSEARIHIKRKKYLLFFGTISSRKGGHEISEVIKPIIIKHNIDFIFIGKSGFGNESNDMVKIIQSENKDFLDRLTFLPPLPQSKLFPFIRLATGVLIPSRCDNFPNTAIEAMHQSRVVITTSQSGLSSALTDCHNGILYDGLDNKGLYSAIDKFLNFSPKELRKIQKNAYETSKYYKSEMPIKELENYYLGLKSKK